MKNLKLIFAALAVLIITLTPGFSKDSQINENDYIIFVTYNENIFPGDAVFVKLSFEPVKGKKVSAPDKFTAEIFQDKKRISQSQFYSISSRRKSQQDYFTGLPLSTWLEAGEAEIKITYSMDKTNQKSFTLPVKLVEKEFESGVINLTQNMSNISNNTSPEKVAQSKKLNDLIATINTDHVYTFQQFISPVTSKRRTTEYGERIVYHYPSGKESTTVHAGIDFGIPTGTQIVSPADGRVVMSENRISTGWTVIVEHLPGLYSMYYHMSELKVKEGQMVKQGDPLGLSGATGFATGPHLHWEIRLETVIVNPDFLMNEDWSHQLQKY